MTCQHRPSWESYWNSRDPRKGNHGYSHFCKCEKCGNYIELSSKSKKVHLFMKLLSLIGFFLMGIWWYIARQFNISIYTIFYVMIITIVYFNVVEIEFYKFGHYVTVQKINHN